MKKKIDAAYYCSPGVEVYADGETGGMYLADRMGRAEKATKRALDKADEYDLKGQDISFEELLARSNARDVGKNLTGISKLVFEAGIQFEADNEGASLSKLSALWRQYENDELPGPDTEVAGGYGALIKGIRETPGIHVLGTLDDDETMVGTSPDGYPWTFYILAEATDRSAVVAACNLLRTIEVGDRKLWSYIRLEARLGRPGALRWTSGSA